MSQLAQERRNSARSQSTGSRSLKPSGAADLHIPSAPGDPFGRRPDAQPPTRRPSSDFTDLQLPPLPQRRTEGSHAGLISFLACVLLPVILAAAYYLLVAAPQFVSEYRFAVRGSPAGSLGGLVAGSNSANMPGSNPSMPSGIASLFGGGASYSTENNIVVEYLSSRQAVDELQERINVRALYARSAADWWARFDPSLPMEDFLSYWQRMVSAKYDQITGTAVVRVRAFTAEDAELIANTMAALSEELVNSMAVRAQRDAIRLAEVEVKRAEDRLKSARAALTQFRNEEGVIDPMASVVTTDVALTQELRSTLIRLESELAVMQRLRSNSPAIPTLQAQISATRKQLAAAAARVADTRDGGKPISSMVIRYEQLELDRQFAQNLLTSAMQSLEQSRAAAALQQFYIVPYVRPALPERAVYPKPVYSIATVAVACFLIWVIVILIIRTIREHVA